MSWLYGFFFSKVLFLFSLTNQAMKIGFPGPNFTVLFFFFFPPLPENGEKLSK